MKKHGILNSHISEVLSNLGHTDKIMIADCGLPIPKNVKKIDLSLKPGTPSFLEVIEVITKDMYIEKYYYAEEMKKNKLYNDLMFKFSEIEGISKTHEELKCLSQEVKVIIRTGDITPYANVILQSGVNFKELYENFSKEY